MSGKNRGSSSFLDCIILFLRMIKIEHSIFALPFAYLGILLYRGSISFNSELLWVSVAMVGARSFAMAVNRYVDRDIDALNPRTANRELPKKLITETEAKIFIGVSLSVYVFAAFQLAPMCRYLWPVMLVPMIIYPYTKKYTYLCHFVLGVSLGLAPLGAWIAVSNSMPPLELILLGLAICFWTAGFDIIYASQDLDFDKEYHLFSIPAIFGLPKALKITAVLHKVTVLLLFTIGLMHGLAMHYFIGVLIVASVLWYENHIISPKDMSRVNMAFFTANGMVSILIFVFTWADFIAK